MGGAWPGAAAFDAEVRRGVRPDGTSFASLWGRGALPEWRGRGICRALVAYRTRPAAPRDYRYPYVDASPDGQPILARLGFSRLARTIPYSRDPGTRA